MGTEFKKLSIVDFYKLHGQEIVPIWYNITSLERDLCMVDEYYGDSGINIINHLDDLKECTSSLSNVRRAFYELRGTPVTEDQAIDIIRLTDDFFRQESDDGNEVIGSIHFRNIWFDLNHFPAHMGWCHPSGLIGMNGITDTYPEAHEILDELASYIKAFPFLDFVIALTRWNEIPSTLWNDPNRYDFTRSFDEEMKYKYSVIDAELENNVAMGYWVHDKTIEILDATEAYQKLNEYKAKSTVNEYVYDSSYYMDNKICPVKGGYIHRCIERFESEATRKKYVNVINKSTAV